MPWFDRDLEMSRLLIEWYRVHKRELPWRETTDPYVIWVSEIMLQQTRVVQGLEYFNRFLRRFPDVVSLAEAEEDEGLRYCRRSVPFHICGDIVVERRG